MRRFRRAAALLITLLLAQAAVAHSSGAQTVAPAAPKPALAEPWAAELAQFAAADRVQPPVPGGVLFVGSSSIRMWSTLGADFPGVRTINRGFGGSELGDVVRLADRVVVPYRPRLIVLYAGDNDLAAGKTPAQVFGAFRQFMDVVHRSLPGTPVAFVAIKPSLAREALLPQIRETNRSVAEYARGDSTVRYVDVYTPMLDSTGRPRAELFQPDGLHMTPTGYALWRGLLTPLVH